MRLSNATVLISSTNRGIGLAGYAVSKSATWSLGNGLRNEMTQQVQPGLSMQPGVYLQARG